MRGWTPARARFEKIHSEKGRDCTLVNPWPGKGIDVYNDGEKIETLKGDRVVMKTKPGDTVLLVQAGTEPAKWQRRWGHVFVKGWLPA